MKKKVYIIMLFLCMCHLYSFSEIDNVAVELPEFKITINGEEIYNDSRVYPFIVYKEITYVPMTYYDSRLLGLETKWDSQLGLQIFSKNIFSTYRENIKGEKVIASTASIPTFKVSINGKELNMSKEKYPLLVYKDITYFPLTWRFAHDEFNWSYSFTENDGLHIDSNKSISKLELKGQSYSKKGVTLANEALYYISHENNQESVTKVNYSNINEGIKLLSFEVDSFLSDIVDSIESFEYNGRVFLHFNNRYQKYGGNYYYEDINDSALSLDIGDYDYIRPYKNGFLVIKLFNGTGPNYGNMWFEESNGNKRRVGEASYWYRGLQFYDGMIYTMVNHNDEYEVFNIDPETNITEKSKFGFESYSSSLDPQLQIENIFHEANGDFYIKDRHLYRNGTLISSETEFKKIKYYDEYIFALTEKVYYDQNIEYGMLILDRNGNTIFKVINPVDQVVLKDGFVYFTDKTIWSYDMGTGAVYKLNLNDVQKDK